MTIREFAAQYGRRVKLDSCRDPILQGRLGHIYDHGDGKNLGVCFMPPPPAGRDHRWGFARKRLVAAGFTIRQNGDTEGTALFDPEKPKQAKLAFRVIRARTGRPLESSKPRARGQG